MIEHGKEFLEEFVLDDCREEAKKHLNIILKEYFKAGVREFAYMKNGVSYVGTTGKTLSKALEEVENEFKRTN